MQELFLFDIILYLGAIRNRLRSDPLAAMMTKVDAIQGTEGMVCSEKACNSDSIKDFKEVANMSVSFYIWIKSRLLFEVGYTEKVKQPLIFRYSQIKLLLP